MGGKAAAGIGTIRKKIITRSGKKYEYWEARVTTGRDPGTGRQLQRSITGKTQGEVAKRLTALSASVDAGTYTDPTKLTVGEWLDIWARDYLGGVKRGTVDAYKGHIKNHIKPALGAVKLTDLHPHTVQSFINGLAANVAPATVRLICATFHQALEKAVDLEYVPKNPARRCALPRGAKKEIKPLEDAQTKALLAAARGGEIEHLVTVALFSGMRMSEIIGLTWDAIDFKRGTISVTKQLTRPDHREVDGFFTTPKSGKPRILAPAPGVLEALKRQRKRQAEQRLKAGPAWDNPHGLVFTTPTGGPYAQAVIDHRFSALCKVARIEGARFHDLRHTYAVNAIRAGDDIKTIQSNLGHYSAAFTLDRYGHFTDQMRANSAARMDGFMKDVLGL